MTQTRKQIAAGNWKMNTSLEEALALASGVAQGSRTTLVLTILASPAVFLVPLSNAIAGKEGIALAAQNCHQKSSGAYTGEISAEMLKSIDIEYVILGHSERREYFYESDELLHEKLLHVLEVGLTPIFCCGEPLEIRKAGSQNEYVIEQLSKNLLLLSEEQILKTIVAYEPIWAIGTGETASPEQAQDMHLAIRNAIAENYGQEVAQSISILYGGSVKGSNAAEIFSKPDVDGGLVGGSSLKVDEFLTIINAF